jgi:hypothetical protein
MPGNDSVLKSSSPTHSITVPRGRTPPDERRGRHRGLSWERKENSQSGQLNRPYVHEGRYFAEGEWVDSIAL